MFRPSSQKYRRWRKGALIMLALLPMALSPSHPIAVYAYLTNVYIPALMRPAYAGTENDLEEFLVATEQVKQYRQSLVADMANTRGGEVFAIVRGTDDTLRLAPLRTWNHFLPARLPEMLRAWLDRKEFPFLADEVELWLEGYKLVAMGHYHAFGGAPSGGDGLAQSFGTVPEVVVTNGIVPLVYLQGEVLPYAKDLEVSPELFRLMRAMTPGLSMAVDDTSPVDKEPSPALIAVLGNLREHQNIDITNRQSVALELQDLCLRFKEAYRFAFEGGYISAPYDERPDHARVVRNLTAIQAWAEIYAVTPVQGI